MRANTSIPIIPSQNMGIETPMFAKKEITLSMVLPRFLAAMMPNRIPVIVPMIKAGITMVRVVPRRGRMMSAISD